MGAYKSRPPLFRALLDASVFLELVALFTVNDGVDSGHFVFTGDPEAEGLLDREAQNQGDDEGVSENREGRDGLNCQLTEVATGEQAGVDSEEPEVQGSHHSRNQVDSDNVKRVVIAELVFQIDCES
jgi:hypothetical protein